jgi:splicing factor 3B subunit 2
MREKRPGVLSKELREALGMTSNLVPPPWLINMQRVGPPPSYPNLKIPGLNAPIPEGAQWGYHAGGWGKPPVDEYNRPLYGDVFGLYSKYQQQLQSSIEASALTNPPVLELWGEFEAVEEVEEQEEVEMEEDEDHDVAAGAASMMGMYTPAGMATPSGISSIATGLYTPDAIQLRKEISVYESEQQEPLHQQPQQQQKALYTVLPQRDTSARDSIMGSAHAYDLKRKFPGTDGMEVTLQPEELENASAEAVIDAKLREAMQPESKKMHKEDVSDMVAEHAAKQAKKRKTDDRSTTAQRKKEFKF